MRILCFIDSLGAGGAQRQLVELSLGFKREGHDVDFLTYHHHSFFKEKLLKASIQTICINESNYLIRLIKIRRFIRQGKYDTVLSFLEASNFISEISCFPYKKWNLIVGERNANPNILKSFKLRTYRWFHFFADTIVANSHENIKLVKKINPLLNHKRLRVIYNSLNLDIWKPSAEYVYRKDEKLNIIVAACHRYSKNLNGLLEGLNQLQSHEKQQIKIDWYGNVDDNSYFEGNQKIAEYKLEEIISLYPANNNILEKIQMADVVGLFSFYEGLPNVICEALACSKPVICSNVSDIPIILKDSNNVLCDPNKPSSIMNGLKKMLSLGMDDMLKIGMENRNIALQYFDKTKITNEYLALLSN